MRVKIAIIAVLTAFFCSCGGASSPSSDVFGVEKFVPEFAKGFRIDAPAEGESSLITISNPWQGADFEQHIFVARAGERAPKGFVGQVVKAPIARAVCLSSGYVAMFDALGEVEKVKGVSGIGFITNDYIRNPQSQVADVGYDANLDFERIVALRPDVVMMYGVAGENAAMTSKLRELGIPYIYIGDYVEQSPLGKAEWIYVVAELTDNHAKADSLFGAVKQNYQNLANRIAAETTTRPKVMLNTPYRDIWFLPSAENYMVRLIADAGGDAYASDSEGNASQPIDSERAYLLASGADVWLNVGGCTSIAELAAQNPRFAQMPAVRNMRVYNNNRRRTSAGGSDFWESGIVRPDVILRDLVKILHPEIVGAEELTYYEQLR